MMRLHLPRQRGGQRSITLPILLISNLQTSPFHLLLARSKLSSPPPPLTMTCNCMMIVMMTPLVMFLLFLISFVFIFSLHLLFYMFFPCYLIS